MHQGEVDWWLYYGVFVGDEPYEDVVTIWEDGDQIMAWGIIEKPNLYDLVLHPSLRDSGVEAELQTFMESRVAAFVKNTDKPQGAVVWEDETRYRALLEKRGYTSTPFLAYFVQPLDHKLPTPLLPEGFRFLDAMHPEWADRRADVHFNSFSPSRMTAEAYTHFMTAPNYDPALDIVVVAPDDTFAAFAMAWVDAETCIGAFEPVGTRATMQRKGLGRAVLLEGMRRMQARGMTVATVCAEADNPGNIAFYQAAGFTLTTMMLKYEKKVVGD
jgi:ribosomal protein S18 acetylase RimI-like enzyme